MHPIAALGPVSTSMNSTALPRNPAVLFLVTFIKVSLQQYKTLHVTLSLIICVMDHCSRAKTRALSGGDANRKQLSVLAESVSICDRHSEW